MIVWIHLWCVCYLRVVLELTIEALSEMVRKSALQNEPSISNSSAKRGGSRNRRGHPRANALSAHGPLEGTLCEPLTKNTSSPTLGDTAITSAPLPRASNGPQAKREEDSAKEDAPRGTLNPNAEPFVVQPREAGSTVCLILCA
jgi:hypothetical protein